MNVTQIWPVICGVTSGLIASKAPADGDCHFTQKRRCPLTSVALEKSDKIGDQDAGKHHRRQFQPVVLMEMHFGKQVGQRNAKEDTS